MYQFLRDNTKWPEISKDACVEGTVYVGFAVNIDGSLSDLQVKRGFSPAFNAEAMRVVSLMSNRMWKCGTQSGKPVRVNFTLPIRFRLE